MKDERDQSVAEACDLPLPERPWVAIVANPFSGSGLNRRRVNSLATTLARHGLEPRILWGATARRRVLAQPDVARWCKCIVAAGGDGTLAAVVNERCDLPVAVLPLGSENLFAHHFGYTLSGDVLARAIISGRTHRLDLGRVGRNLFTLVMSAGYDADVIRRVHAWRTRSPKLQRVNRLRYVKHALAALHAYPQHPIEMEADGRRFDGVQVFVFNVPTYACRAPIAPKGRTDDGLFEWVLLRRRGRRRLCGFYAEVLLGARHLRRADVAHGQAQNIRIIGESPVPVEIDGDAAGFTPIEVEVAPRAVPVIVP